MRTLFAALIAICLAGAATAHDGIHVENAYARVAMANAPTAAVFMNIVNHAPKADRLIAVESDVAGRAELHTHVMSADGMMQMLPVDGGLPIDAAGTRSLARGGDHVMLIGLTQPLAEGAQFTLTLTFENAGKLVVVVPVRNEDPAGVAPMDHSGHGTVAPTSE